MAGSYLSMALLAGHPGSQWAGGWQVGGRYVDVSNVALQTAFAFRVSASASVAGIMFKSPADWISDAEGEVNLTITLPYLRNQPGRHHAIISLVPGTVTISDCGETVEGNSISPGCPGYDGEIQEGFVDSLIFYV
mmetsp:Transcript_41856/g.65404  ORF Transcript_41856/g.65404 Transcript_41856/m.65404 type:complete len:135 (+) Transcript_41856:168-572(+)